MGTVARLRWGAFAAAVAFVVMLVTFGSDHDGDDSRGLLPPGTVPTTGEQIVGGGGATDVRVVVGSITDGDTFRTTDGERVRFIGIDTPEVDQDQCYADEATAALEALIPPGTEVRLVRDVDPFDRYERTLAYVERVDDGLDVGLRLAADGYAVQLTVPPNVAREAAIGAAVAAAREAGLGLWGEACA